MKCEIKDCEFHRWSHVFYIRHKDFPEILSYPQMERVLKECQRQNAGLKREHFQAVPSKLWLHGMTKEALIRAYAFHKVMRQNDRDFGLKKTVKR